MPPHWTLLFSNLQPVWGGIDRNVPCKAVKAATDPAGPRSLRPSRPRPSGAVQRPGTCTADASWHSSALCTVLALRERPNTRPFLVPSLAFYQLILTYDVLAGSFLMRLALLKVSKSQKKNLKTTLPPKTNKVLDKILPLLHRAEFCLIFRFLGYGISRKIGFEIYWPLYYYNALLGTSLPTRV